MPDTHSDNHDDDRSRLIRGLVRDVPDFPKPGIVFKDVTPLLGDARGLATCLELLGDAVREHRADLVVGIESRGFIFGAPLAAQLGVGFAPVRKPGKLPFRRVRETYTLEYGTDALEMHEDAVAHRRCLVVDDLLATGGTAAATARLVARGGGEVAAFAFVIELGFLDGRKALGGVPVHALLRY